MDRQEALRIIRREITAGGKYMNAEVSRAMAFLESDVQPIGYIEPGRTYVLQVGDLSWPAAGILNRAIGVFQEINCRVIILGPNMNFISLPTANQCSSRATVNPCDACMTRLECTGVCERLAAVLSKDG